MNVDWVRGRDITVGSLFSGYGGLDDGTVRALLALGARSVRVAWVADIDPGASRILAHRYPGVPNLGDITAVDWTAVEPVDVATGGFPCQDGLRDVDGRDRQDADGHPGEPETRFGPYGPAITRWAHIVGRPAPDPTIGGRLSPRFVEWMMGLPDGWVTDVPGLKRNDTLKALGNGVVPQQAERALRVLLSAGRAS